jgi:hypothetical protein
MVDVRDDLDRNNTSPEAEYIRGLHIETHNISVLFDRKGRFFVTSNQCSVTSHQSLVVSHQSLVVETLR